MSPKTETEDIKFYAKNSTEFDEKCQRLAYFNDSDPVPRGEPGLGGLLRLGVEALLDVDTETQADCSACDESERQPGVPADRSSCKDDEREGDAAPDERFFEFVFCVHTSSVVDGDQIKYLIFYKNTSFFDEMCILRRVVQ